MNARALCAAAALLALGCDNPTDSTENELIPNAGLPRPGGGGDSAGGETPDAGDGAACAACAEVGRWYRTQDIRVVSIDNHPGHLAVNSLNGEWEFDIARGELTLFFRMVGQSDEGIDFEVVNGMRDDATGTVCVAEDRTTPMRLELEGCGLQSVSLFDIFIYGGSIDHPKICAPSDGSPNAIYIQHVDFRATVDDTCGEMNAHVTGMISQPHLRDTCACLLLREHEFSDECGVTDAQPAGGLGCGGCGQGSSKFGNLEGSLELLSFGSYPGEEVQFALCTTEDGDPAVCLEASIRMELVDPPPPPCSR